ncbi:MAG: S8 family serine peptidase [Gemmataceae bacterium]
MNIPRCLVGMLFLLGTTSVGLVAPPLLGGAEASLRNRVRCWHHLSQRGQGITVAILDSGWKGWREARGKVLPATVEARSFRADGDLEARESVHGILCAEVVHALAPEARLLLANWEPDVPRSFLAAVRWAREQGAQILSCSMIMPGWSDGEGNGPVHEQLARLLGDDALFIASAGNTACRHWGGPFNPDRLGLHQWKPGCIENELLPYGASLSVELVHGEEAVFDLVVVNLLSRDIVGRTRSSGIGWRHAAVRFEVEQSQRYAVRVERVRGTGRFHLTILGGGLTHCTSAGSIPFPGDGAKVLTVAATDEQGQRLPFSSCGPAGRFPKPDLAARVPVSVKWRPEAPFSGTSAAAPQVAGIAALLWSAEPHLDAKAMRARLTKATSSGGKRHDPKVGYGVIQFRTTTEKK